MIRILPCLLIFAFIACGEEDPINENCPDLIVVNEAKYKSINNDNDVLIQEMSIENDCLVINIGFSGCDDDHTIVMVTDGAVAESFPVQVHFKLLDENPQACLAYFTKEFNYDLNQLNAVVTTEPKARLIFSEHGKEILWERN